MSKEKSQETSDMLKIKGRKFIEKFKDESNEVNLSKLLAAGGNSNGNRKDYSTT